MAPKRWPHHRKGCRGARAHAHTHTRARAGVSNRNHTCTLRACLRCPARRHVQPLRMPRRPLCARWHNYAGTGAGKFDVGRSRSSSAPRHQWCDERALGALTLGVPKDHVCERRAGRAALGMAGSCILITRSKSNEILQTLTPPSANLTGHFVVIFTTCKQDVRNAKMLEVPRVQHLR